MAMSMSLNQYLSRKQVDYDVLKHKHTTNSFDTAYTAHIPMAHLAKAVILRDENDRYMMAVVPSMNKVKLRWLNKKLNRRFQLVSERELRSLFEDCELGAIPALGDAFNLDMICDDQLLEEPYVYIEAGDHEELVKLDHEQFNQLMRETRHARISTSAPTYSPYHDADMRGF